MIATVVVITVTIAICTIVTKMTTIEVAGAVGLEIAIAIGLDTALLEVTGRTRALFPLPP